MAELFNILVASSDPLAADLGCPIPPKRESGCVKYGFVSKPFGVVTRPFRNLVKRG
ncbi:hypothetical protein PV773_00910 [Mesorhizobium sp. CC13]|uniref:hypothetical protein n=1 Tax=Mesorhizobium sp. CC13 TaxID=3029194 RepID=UPI0032633205